MSSPCAADLPLEPRQSVERSGGVTIGSLLVDQAIADGRAVSIKEARQAIALAILVDRGRSLADAGLVVGMPEAAARVLAARMEIPLPDGPHESIPRGDQP
jgi:hypothetical protein